MTWFETIAGNQRWSRSEEHTSELQSPIDISYAVFCLKKKKKVVDKQSRNHHGHRLDDKLVDFAGHELTSGLHLRQSDLAYFFNETATTEIYTSIDTLSLHDALPISVVRPASASADSATSASRDNRRDDDPRSEEHTSELQSPIDISYAVFCLKK